MTVVKFNRFAMVNWEGKRLKAVKDANLAECPSCHKISDIEKWQVWEWGRKTMNSAVPYCCHVRCPKCGKVNLALQLSFYLTERRKLW